MKLEFSQQIFFKCTQISNFMKIHMVEAELCHVDRLTDMMKLIVTFCCSVNATKNLLVFIKENASYDFLI